MFYEFSDQNIKLNFQASSENIIYFFRYYVLSELLFSRLPEKCHY